MKDFEYIELKAGEKIKVSDRLVAEVRPFKLYKLPTGAKGDKPSYALLCEMADGSEIIAQISEEMFMKEWK